MNVHVLGTVRATDAQRATGLLAWLTIETERLVLDSVQLRRTLDGRHVLSWPERRDAGGRKHAVVRPVDDDARRAIEAAIFEQLGVSP